MDDCKGCMYLPPRGRIPTKICFACCRWHPDHYVRKGCSNCRHERRDVGEEPCASCTHGWGERGSSLLWEARDDS